VCISSNVNLFLIFFWGSKCAEREHVYHVTHYVEFFTTSGKWWTTTWPQYFDIRPHRPNSRTNTWHFVVVVDDPTSVVSPAHAFWMLFLCCKTTRTLFFCWMHWIFFIRIGWDFPYYAPLNNNFKWNYISHPTLKMCQQK